jgi:SAM-dependent methyltransferase
MSNSIARGFRDVDAQAHNEDFGAYLAQVTRALAAEKQSTHDRLEPESGQRVLDAGCGIGDDVRALARRVAPGGRVTGIDRSETMIAAAREGGVPAGVEFHVADAHDLPFPDASFDAARVERTLQHVQDPRRVIEELARVVRPGGLLVASEPDWGTLTVDAADRDATWDAVRALCDEHIRNGWIGRQLAGHFAHLGLAAVEVHAATLALRSLPVAVDIFRLAEVGRADWLEDLRERDGRGAFFAAVTGFTVSGRVC